MVRKQAETTSPAQQYQQLVKIRRAHVNQFINDQRRWNPSWEWSCVYVEEHRRACKARNAGSSDFETVSMTVILLKRPLNIGPYPRTPMGDLVDLRCRQGWYVVPPRNKRPSARVYWQVPAMMRNTTNSAANARVVRGRRNYSISKTCRSAEPRRCQRTVVLSERLYEPRHAQTTPIW